ncbi:MAG: hypothetical protein ACI4EF_09850 [Coprococcus sp.]
MAKDSDMMTEAFKTVKFGGYDKNSVDSYIADMKSAHAKEVEELKDNVNKLSEAVLSLKTMREVNMNESNKTIDGLKAANADYEAEIASLKEQLNAYKEKEYESAGRYESISRTLLEARESADLLVKQTTEQCQQQEAETKARCEALEQETTDRCNKLQTDTDIKCQQMYDQTEATCNNLKEQAYSESERTRNKAHEAAETLTAKTEYECRTMKENAENEAENIVNTATDEAYRLRMNVKRECESVSKYMSDLLSSLDGVVAACSSTKEVADKAFTGLKSNVADTSESEDAQ